MWSRIASASSGTGRAGRGARAAHHDPKVGEVRNSPQKEVQHGWNHVNNGETPWTPSWYGKAGQVA